jgi:hypothetical protein
MSEPPLLSGQARKHQNRCEAEAQGRNDGQDSREAQGRLAASLREARREAIFHHWDNIKG